MALSSLTHTNTLTRSCFVCLSLSLFPSLSRQLPLNCNGELHVLVPSALYSRGSPHGVRLMRSFFSLNLPYSCLPLLLLYCFYYGISHEQVPHPTSILMNQGKEQDGREVDELPVYLSAAESFSFTQTEQQPGSPDAEAHPALDHLPSCQPRALPSPVKAQ